MKNLAIYLGLLIGLSLYAFVIAKILEISIEKNKINGPNKSEIRRTM